MYKLVRRRPRNGLRFDFLLTPKTKKEGKERKEKMNFLLYLSLLLSFSLLCFPRSLVCSLLCVFLFSPTHTHMPNAARGVRVVQDIQRRVETDARIPFPCLP